MEAIVMIARRAKIKITYNNKDISADLEPYLIKISYTDFSSGKSDDLQVELEDRKGLWRGDWLPEKGAILKAILILQNWEKEGEEQVPLGTFEVDEISCDGPPSTVKIKALSLPESTSLRGENKNRAWEKVKLSTIAKDIATGAGLELVYDTDDDAEYDRTEQTEESDLEYLQGLCSQEALSLKITDNQIVIFDDKKFEQMDPVCTIERGVDMMLNYSINSKTRDVYSSCRVEYQQSEQKETIKYTFVPPNKPATGKTLVVNKRVSSIAEAEKLAKKELRQKNKDEVKVTLTMIGNCKFMGGVTVLLKEFGKFDGKYFVEDAGHDVGSGYTTKLSLRQVLEGY